MNVSFLSQGYLWALPLAAFPVLLHLLLKRTPHKITFSDTRYIIQAMERVKTGLRIHRYLVLLLRTLSIFLIVGYFAHPMFQVAAGGSHASIEPAPVVFIVDTSFSMGAQENGVSRLDACKKLAMDVLSIIPKEARTGVIVVSNRVEAHTNGLTNDVADLSRMINNIKLTNRPTDISPAWNTLRKMLENYHGVLPVVVLLTDGTKHAFRGRLADNAVSARILLPKFQTIANCWLTQPSVTFNNELDQWECNATAMRSNNIQNAVPFELHIDGRKVASDISKPFKDGSLRAHMVWSPKAINSFGRISISQDALPIDNDYWVALHRHPRFDTWLIDGDPRLGGMGSKTMYLRKIFTRSQTLREDDAGLKEFTPPGTIILANVRDYSPSIEEFIRNGGGCIVFLGDRFDSDAEPEWFPAEVGNSFDLPQKIEWKDMSHPIAEEISIKDYDLKNVLVNKGFVLAARPNSKVLANLGNGWPYIVERKYGAGNVLLFCSGADRDWGNIVAHPIFVTLLKTAAKYAASPKREDVAPNTVVDGEFLYKKVNDPTIMRPDGNSAQPYFAGEELIYTGTDLPGIYSLLSKGKQITSFDVNLDNSTGESDLTIASLQDAHSYFKGMPLVAIETSKWKNSVRMMLSGTDISRQWLFAAIILLLLELWLSTKKGARNDCR